MNAAIPQDDFKGDDAQLVRSISALLTIDAAGSLAPHGIGGHARALLAAAASRLAAATAAQPDTSNRVSVDCGALNMALSVLRRAGKTEVAEALEKTCGERGAATAAQPDRLVGYVLRYPHKDGTCHYGSYLMDKGEAQATAANSEGQAEAMPVYAATAAQQPHPDTARMDWLEDHTIVQFPRPPRGGTALREAIDAAMGRSSPVDKAASRAAQTEAGGAHG